jgi:hypothetical protein
MRRVNLSAPETTTDAGDPPGFRASMFRFGKDLGATATTYPDSDKVAIWTGKPGEDLIVPRSAGVDYWAGHPGV